MKAKLHTITDVCCKAKSTDKQRGSISAELFISSPYKKTFCRKHQFPKKVFSRSLFTNCIQYPMFAERQTRRINSEAVFLPNCLSYLPIKKLFAGNISFQKKFFPAVCLQTAYNNRCLPKGKLDG